MKQQYFVLVLAHSLHGRLRRIQVPHRIIYAIVAFAAIGFFSVLGAVTSYARMAWKVANYNSLREEITSLRARYAKLQKESTQAHDQLASLQLFASEISMAYGLKQRLEGPTDISSEGRLIPTIQQSIEEYNLLRTANLSSFYHRYPRAWQVNVIPSLWPVDGRLFSYFGKRTDPFSGEGAIHRGVDIDAPPGTPVRATADGIVVYVDWMSTFGRLVVIDHGNGLQTYYAHLSSFGVVPGQEVRQGSTIGAVGSSGRAAGPHLHYEVRNHGNPVNPTRFMARTMAQSAKRDFPF